MHNLRYFLPLIFIFSTIPWVHSQDLDSLSNQLLKESAVLQDSINLADTLASDSLISGQIQPQGDIETTINYTAKDSINFDVQQQIVTLYGNAKIDYGLIQLEAAKIEIDWVNNTLSAKYEVDSTGKKIGVPVFKDGAETYETDQIVYNFDSKKAVITGLVTAQQGGFIHGNKVVKNDKDELFIPLAKYTTCNLPNPHFHIEAKKLKAIPDEKVVSGPFHLEFNDIPTPLGFAFGMFPDPKKSKSGIIFPTYGEEARRGFFLRDGGYFFDISEYIKVSVTGEIYSKGSRGLTVNSSYKKRYAYSGGLNLAMNRLTSGLEGDSSVTNDFWLRWNHSPVARGSSRFSASVNAGTSTYNSNNSSDVNLNSRATFNSSISYSKTFTGTPFNMAASFRHNQDVNTKKIDIQFPELSMNMSRIFPLKNVGRNKSGPLQSLGFSYAFSSTNRISNQLRNVPASDGRDSIADFNFDNLPLFLENAQNGARHSIPISTNTKILNYFTLSPSFNYDGLIYLRELNYEWNEEANELVTDTIQGLSLSHTFNVGASLNTRFYGLVNFAGDKAVKAIRHVVTPSISFNYRPDFSDPKYGYYQEVQVDSLGNTERKSIYQGFVYGSPSSGESAAVGFSLNNNIEMKVRDKKDTLSGTKKIPIFENLSFSSSYNFVADSFNLAPVSMNARTKIGTFDINFSGTLDPYIWVVTGVDPETGAVSQKQISEFAWNNGRGLGQISRANIAIRTNLNPKMRESQANAADNVDRNGASALDGIIGNDALEAELDYIRNNPDEYVDFNIPWSLNVSYSWNYNKRGFESSDITQTLRFSGNLSLTPKWKINFNSGFDFESKEFTQTSLGLTRDLHCWVLDFNWTPFGRFESYSLDIHVKSSLLQDLKLSKRRSFRDNSGF